MKVWTLNIRYNGKIHKLKATVEYESNQIMRIRIEGKTSSILLENNYPINQFSPRPKPIKWKLKEGTLKGTDQKQNAQFLSDIMTQLEHFVKGKHTEPTAAEYLQRNKW